MKFCELARVFQEIEQESSRLKITELLADVLKSALSTEAENIAYFSLGELNPVYVGTQFNFAEKGVLKVLARITKTTIDEVKSNSNQTGDLGSVIERYAWEVSGDNLTVDQVHDRLKKLLNFSGTGSQELKEKFLEEILYQLDPISAKYVIRIILGKLRLGFSDMTLLDAFSWMFAGDKSIRLYLEEAYNVCADIGLIIKTLKQDGLEGIKKVSITPGIPIRPAAAERLASPDAIIKKLGKCVAQPKLDGFRLQVHIDKSSEKPVVHFFSRNLQEMSQMFPDLKKAVLALDVDQIVAEGEAIAFDVQTGGFLPFQETVKRKRKHQIDLFAQDYPLKLYIFDVLFLNGKSLLGLGHEERRQKLLCLLPPEVSEEDVICPIEEKIVDTAQALEDYFEQNIASGLEGLVVKRLDAIYQPGKRNFNWIKLKRTEQSGGIQDTLDCVILGYYHGKGKRASFGIGALLVGVFNQENDMFQTVAKIGTGLSDQGWRDQKKVCDKIAVDRRPSNIECAKELYPDVWINPGIVCLVRADEITKSPLHAAGSSNNESGLALRFPRIMGYRPDKSAAEATTADELKRLYNLQGKK